MQAVPNRRLLLIGFFVLMAFCPRVLPVHAGTAAYGITNLGFLGGATSVAYAINNKGEVAGNSDLAGSHNYHAFLWEGRTLKDLGVLGGGSYSDVYSINNHGQVVGSAELSAAGDSDPGMCDSQAHACRAFLVAHGTMHDLGTLGGESSEAAGINDRLQVVGASETNVYSQVIAFLWQKGLMKPLGGSLRDESWSFARGINNLGQVIGVFGTGPGRPPRGFIWYENHMTDLGAGVDSWSEAAGINNIGQVVGARGVNEKSGYAFLWSKGTMHNLGIFAGDTGSEANAINDAGFIVGDSYRGKQFSRAVLWDDGQTIDLNSLVPARSGWHLQYAYGINESGLIVGQGTFHGKERAYLLTPIVPQ